MGGLPWLKLDGDSPLHPKVARLEAALGIHDAFGIIARVWCWTSKYAPAGIVLPEDQPSFAKWITSSLPISADKVVESLLFCRVLDLHKKGLEVHGWEEYEGAHILKAEGNKKRQQEFRYRNALRNAHTVTPRNATEKRREEKKEDQKALSPSQAKVDAVHEVFAYWQQVMARPRTKLDDVRRRKIQARLAEGRTVAEIKLAIDGCSMRGHNMGDNENGTAYNDIELICRNGPKFEGYMLTAEEAKKPASGPAYRRETDEEIELRILGGKHAV